MPEKPDPDPAPLPTKNDRSGGSSADGKAEPPQTPDAANLLGREFITAVVVFHESVGRLLGLTAVERKCLDILSRLGPVTAGAIAEHTGLTSGAVTGLVDRLQTAGYVDRAPDPSDRRRVLVSLRPETKLNEVMPKVFGPLGVDMQAITSSFQPAELLAIADFLRRTTDTLVKHTTRINHHFDDDALTTPTSHALPPAHLRSGPRRTAASISSA